MGRSGADRRSRAPIPGGWARTSGAGAPPGARARRCPPEFFAARVEQTEHRAARPSCPRVRPRKAAIAAMLRGTPPPARPSRTEETPAGWCARRAAVAATMLSHMRGKASGHSPTHWTHEWPSWLLPRLTRGEPARLPRRLVRITSAGPVARERARSARGRGCPGGELQGCRDRAARGAWP